MLENFRKSCLYCSKKNFQKKQEDTICHQNLKLQNKNLELNVVERRLLIPINNRK